jgi:hypothetical protein
MKNKAVPNQPKGGKLSQTPGGNFGDPSTGPGAFAAEVKDQIDGVGAKVEAVAGTVDALGQKVGKFGARIEAVENRPAVDTEDLDAKFEKLATGEQFATVAEQIAALETKVERQGQFGGTQPKPDDAWTRYFNSSEFAEFIKGQCKDKDGVKLNVDPVFGRSLGGQFAVTVDSTLVGSLDVPAQRAGVIELLRDPIGLVDVVQFVPPINSQNYEYYKETTQSETAVLGTTLTVAIDGDPTPKTTCTVANSEGFVPGVLVLFYDASEAVLASKTLVSKDDATGVLTFATDDLDFDATIGWKVTTEEILATAEGALKPAGFIAAEQDTLSLQTIAVWLETTRQRLQYTNVTDLASWINRKLPQRLRETLEWHLLYGSGTNSQLHGFLNSGILPAGQTDTWSSDMEVGDTRADLILWSATQIPGDVRTVAVLHKNDWFRITNYKATDGHYVQNMAEGPTIINTPGLKAIGSVQVVLTRKIVETTGLVFAPDAASEVVPAGDAELWTGYVGEQRVYNKQTHLYEQSLGHAITDSRAFRKVVFDAAPS